MVNIGNGIPKKIITNYNGYENNNNYQKNDINKKLLTNYTYKRIFFDKKNNLQLNNNKNDLEKRIKTPIIRRCKTSNNINNIDLNKFKINLNSCNLNENIYKNIFFTHKKYVSDKLNIINNNERKNSVKYSVTNGGSTVSVHGNTINGLPIIQGVCSKCINNELIKLKSINKQLYTYNNIKNSRIFESEKEKIIEQNSNVENGLNNLIKDNIREKVIIDYLKNEQYLKNKNYNQYNIKTEVDKYLLNSNKLSKFSVPSIGLEKFKNKYLPTKEQYINNLNEQIKQKKKSEEKLKKKEQDEFNYYTNKNIVKGKLEEESRIKNEREKEIKLLKENIKLAQERKNKELLDKSADIALEKKYNQISENKDKEEIENKKVIKLRIKRNLKEKLEEQIQYKIKRHNSFDFRKRIKRNKSRNIPDISDINIYTENTIKQYGRCFNCQKLFKKNLICDKGEYDNIKKIEISKEKELNKILNEGV